MKTLGYILITVGFLVGALGGVRSEAEGIEQIDWSYFVPGFVAGVAGVALARIGARRETTEEGVAAANFENLVKHLDSIVVNITQLDSEKESMDPYDANGRIDELFRDDLNGFVDARESLIHLFSMSVFADVMNDFAVGERYLNRVWSASIDGYIDEVQEYLGRSREQFVSAQAKVRALQSP